MRTFVAQLAQLAQLARLARLARLAKLARLVWRDVARCGRVRRVPAGLRTPKEKGAAGNPDSSWWCDMVLAGERLP